MPPVTLFRYISLRSLIAFGAIYGVLAGLVFLADLIENMRFAGKVENGNFGFALQLTALRTLGLTQALTPFVFLFGGLWAFNQLNRKSELAVMRSAGLSVWRLIGPPALIAALSGLIIISLIDPMSARMMDLGEKMKNDIRGKTSSLVRVFGDGIWLRQRDVDATLIINAAHFDPAKGALTGVTIWRMGADSSFQERIDAPKAVLAGRTIELHNATMKGPGQQLAQKTPMFAVATNLTLDDLQSSVPLPETMSIWDLPRFILLAEAAGLPTIRYDIRFHDLCSTPLKLVAMVMIAAMFSLRPLRQGGAFGLVVMAVITGFFLYVLAQISTALGESGSVSVALAAWTPAVIAAIVAITRLLQVEDG